MCGIACSINNNNSRFEQDALKLLSHRGPDDNGLFKEEGITLLQTRLSILELTDAGHQPMVSSCGRYVISYNGEIYNHRELREKYLKGKKFRGESDTETILELFALKKEDMLSALVGMWAMMIWDKEAKQLFISRDRYGQKPLYYRRNANGWLFASEIKPLLDEKQNPYEETAVVEFLALGNYGHLGDRTFFKNIRQFPQGSFCYLNLSSATLEPVTYWRLPDIPGNSRRPFDAVTKKELHDAVVEAVLSQTLADVPIGITLSGGIDSSIVAGILASYYDKNINVFTAQAIGSSHDESKYVDAVMAKYPHLNIHRYDLKSLSLKEDVQEYVNIQEEPFGDPSIIGHGHLMKTAAANNVKVVLGGQGADELFFGYGNMSQAILLRQLRKLQLGDFFNNINNMALPGRTTFLARTFLVSAFPGIERSLRARSRKKRREVMQLEHLNVDESLFQMPRYDNVYDVWTESVYGIHLPHLVHYDDRNAMANSIEGRMPFLDHRIAEVVAGIKPEYYLRQGLRKFPLREACAPYLPDEVRYRKDKIGFYTPLINAIYKDSDWVIAHLQDFLWIKENIKATLLNSITSKRLDLNQALLIWRFVVVKCWIEKFNVSI